MESIIDGKKIVELREARGWSQIDLSRHSTINKSVLSRLERNLQKDFKFMIIYKLAESLDIPITALIKAEEKTETNEFPPELHDAINQLKRHNTKTQSQVAAIIHAFLNTLEEEN